MHFAFLGTAGALPSLGRDNTALAFTDGVETVLVDCGGSPIQKLLLAAIDPLTVSRVVMTHLHVDHAYGLPSLLRNLGMLGRRAPLRVHCREEHVEPLRALLGVFRLLDRPDMYSVELAPVRAVAGAPVTVAGPFTVSAAPNAHGNMPNLALRVDVTGGPAVVYSSDTEPCDAVVALSRGADTLIHEATYAEGDGHRVGAHSTAAQAGEVAARAGVRRLILTHMDARHHDGTARLADEARARFAGEVEIAEEFIPYPL